MILRRTHIRQTMNNRTLYISFLFSVLIIVGAWFYSQSIKKANDIKTAPAIIQEAGENQENPVNNGIIIPVIWDDLGIRMVEGGVIDELKFKSLYQGRGGVSPQDTNLLDGSDNGQLKVNSQNAGYLLNLLWALGLGNKNDILEKGEMADPRYGGAGNFASTGGWTIAVGDPMSHYSAHAFVVLTQQQQELVDRVSKNIYRPCCGNSTHFPDCNHGMAMLGLLELMASQNLSESDMYHYALEVNKLWFPDTYAAINAYLKTRGHSIETVDPKEILGPKYSSLAGYKNILKLTSPPAGSSGGSCGV